jgi:multiple sugar transport system substrate-binding protein
MSNFRRTAVGLTFVALIAGACGAATPSGPESITVWDYYGEATPIKPVIAAFEAENPNIKVNYEALDWDNMNDKFTAGIAAGEVPDVATLDLQWLPTLASNGVFEDLSALSGGQLNGSKIDDQYSPGALEAMTFDDHFVTMLYDFDVYSLYYRSDLFDAQGIPAPKTWADVRAAMKKIAVDSDNDGKADKNLYAVVPDSARFSQFLFQNGGSILNEDGTKAVFNSDAGVEAVEQQKGFLDDGTGFYWASEDDLIQPLNDGSVAAFSDGPYYMGLLKTGVPDQAGKWKVATAPFSKQPGSYLGGTGLGIPAKAEHKAAAWKFIEFLLRPENEVGVFTYAGAAPATTAALQSPELSKPDPYFGDQAPFPVFAEAMSTATHFPYIGQWNDIDTTLTDTLESIMTGQQAVKEALDGAAADVDDLLAK